MRGWSGRSGPDRHKPEWAKPLAPLPEWLDSVDELLRSVRSDSESPILRVRRAPGYRPEVRREWMRSWREMFSLTEAQAAEILGNSDADAIVRFEADRPPYPKRNDKLQQALAEERLGNSVTNRTRWLKEWRKRIGISQRRAAHLLGYTHRLSICNIEYGVVNPSWEKILVAHHAEKVHAYRSVHEIVS